MLTNISAAVRLSPPAAQVRRHRGGGCGAAAAVRDLYAGMPDTFDLDLAVGAQLDTVGRWIGLGRRRHADLRRVLRAGHRGAGHGPGRLAGAFDPDNGLTVLDDDTYRLLLRAKIGANHWDGTLETSAAILNQIFQGGTHVLIEDNGDMSVDIGVAARRLRRCSWPC